MKHYIESLRKRTLLQKTYIERMIEALSSLYSDQYVLNQHRCDDATLESSDEEQLKVAQITTPEDAPRSIQELCRKYQRLYSTHERVAPYTPATILLHEKDPPSAIFHKLSQLLLKWSELELSILKELHKAGEDGEQDAPLAEEDLAILRAYFADSDTEVNE